MRLALKMLLWLAVGIVAAAGASLWLSVQSRPLVAVDAPLSPDEVDRVKRLLRENDPRRGPPGSVRTVTLDERELGLAASHLVGLLAPAGVRVGVFHGRLEAYGSMVLPDNPLGRYLNVRVALLEGAARPRFETLRVGHVPVPAWLANLALAGVVRRLDGDEDARALLDAVHEVRFTPGRVAVTYEWHADALRSLRDRAVPQAVRLRLETYHLHLVALAEAVDAGSPLGVSDLLAPLLALAQARTSDGGNAVAENRAAIVVLEAYVNGRGLGAVVPAARTWPRPRRHRVRMQGRRDFPQHFLTSAALSALGGTALADVLGLYKEVDDARGGSGFSFTDLMADRAGSRFGAVATASPASARRVQALGSRITSDAELLPPALDLPERMSEVELRERYGGVGAPEYERVRAEIERRLDALGLYGGG